MEIKTSENGNSMTINVSRWELFALQDLIKSIDIWSNSKDSSTVFYDQKGEPFDLTISLTEKPLVTENDKDLIRKEIVFLLHKVDELTIPYQSSYGWDEYTEQWQEQQAWLRRLRSLESFVGQIEKEMGGRTRIT